MINILLIASELNGQYNSLQIIRLCSEIKQKKNELKNEIKKRKLKRRGFYSKL